MPGAGVQAGEIAGVLRRYWGFEALRPLQERAIRCALAGRDSLVVMPTGGGKSLCYQAPPLLTGRLGVVISPLIALMKDQVDALRLVGYPAAALHSGLAPGEASEVFAAIRGDELRLLLVSPERLLAGGGALLDRLAGAGVSTIAVDEAHCISQWGHDFRPEYRRLAEVRERFPGASFHAFTATATPKVREDIAAQLGLHNPEVLVGVFDRPNLVYRITPKEDLHGQVEQAVRRHDGGASIVYCISRKNTEELAGYLRGRGLAAAAYHAGMGAAERRGVQDDFAQERLGVVVATVAFGMGIDRSNIRCVVHAAMPKSIEHYQQETGRAGRDGLEAECVMLYSAGDAAKWHEIIDRGAEENETSPEFLHHQHEHVEEVRAFASGVKCRHRFLSEYFGQAYAGDGGGGMPGCGACDICLGEFDAVPGAGVIAQKILSCVARVAVAGRTGGRPGAFGAGHIIGILRGSTARAITERGHHLLSTFGILRDVPPDVLGSYINQLLDQGVLEREQGRYPTLVLNRASLDVLKGGAGPRGEVTLVRPKEPVRTAQETGEEPYDPGLFEALRVLRREIALERSVPAYVVFSDAALQEMARWRPTGVRGFREIRGVGERKAEELGPRFTAAIAAYARSRGLETDRTPPKPAGAPRRARPPVGSASGRRAEFTARFDRGESVEEVAAALGVMPGTAANYLVSYVEEKRPASLSPWIDGRTYEAVAEAAKKLDTGRLRPIFEHFAGEVPYDQIRLVMAHIKSASEGAP